MLPVYISHDEHMFIRVLQTFETTFALLALSIRTAIGDLDDARTGDATGHLAVAETVLAESAPLFSLLATMQVESFRVFRDFTDGASAIQSRNYKLVESLCRVPDKDRLDSPAYRSTPEVHERVLVSQPTLDEACGAALADPRFSAADRERLTASMLGFGQARCAAGARRTTGSPSGCSAPAPAPARPKAPRTSARYGRSRSSAASPRPLTRTQEPVPKPSPAPHPAQRAKRQHEQRPDPRRHRRCRSRRHDPGGPPRLLRHPERPLRARPRAAQTGLQGVPHPGRRAGDPRQVRLRRDHRRRGRHLDHGPHLCARQGDPRGRVHPPDRLRPVREHIPVPDRAASAGEGRGRPALRGPLGPRDHRGRAGRRHRHRLRRHTGRPARLPLPVHDRLRRCPQPRAHVHRRRVDRLQPPGPLPDHRPEGEAAARQGAPLPLRPALQPGSPAGHAPAAQRHLAHRLAARPRDRHRGRARGRPLRPAGARRHRRRRLRDRLAVHLPLPPARGREVPHRPDLLRPTTPPTPCRRTAPAA